jgi:UrcA family protein
MIRPLTAAALFALFVVLPAFGADDLKQVTVVYGDLDLHSTAGQTELRARLIGAASKLCHPHWMAEPPDSEMTARECQVIYRACLGRVSNRAMARIDDARQARN